MYLQALFSLLNHTSTPSHTSHTCDHAAHGRGDEHVAWHAEQLGSGEGRRTLELGKLLA